MIAGAEAWKELRRTIAEPSRTLKVFDRRYRSYLALRLRYGQAPMVDGRRRYRSYRHYVAHQRSKLTTLDLTGYDVTFRRDLAERLRTIDVDWSAQSVLCLAARIGTEVRAFRDLGAFAVGIDLNPGPANPLVLHGDFHDLPFADGSVDVVYCNSLDHALDLHRLVSEAHRVLRQGGLFIAEAIKGAREGTGEFGSWEARSWDYVDDLVAPLEAGGYALRATDDFESPWRGRRFVLERTELATEPSRPEDLEGPPSPRPSR